jgi:protein-disulfide isomerase
MSDLRSAPLPPVCDSDHVRGARNGLLLIEYGDLECAFCAALHARLERLRAALAVRHVYRHFPVRSSHPRAFAAACATEAAAAQGAFWQMRDAVLCDQGHIEDPHLWALAQRLGLDLERFEQDRRAEQTRARVTADFLGGVRAGVVTTPTVFIDGVAYAGERLRERLERLAVG